MPQKRTEAADKPKRRQIDIDDLLYRRCGMVAAGLGLSIPEYVHQRMTKVVLQDLESAIEATGMGPLPPPPPSPKK